MNIEHSSQSNKGLESDSYLRCQSWQQWGKCGLCLTHLQCLVGDLLLVACWWYICSTLATLHPHLALPAHHLKREAGVKFESNVLTDKIFKSPQEKLIYTIFGLEGGRTSIYVTRPFSSFGIILLSHQASFESLKGGKNCLKIVWPANTFLFNPLLISFDQDTICYVINKSMFAKNKF